MIPTGIRLYSWVDVEDVLVRAQESGSWPDWLVWARAYWDGLTLAVKPGTNALGLAWLAESFEPRFLAHGPAIKMESIPGNERLLPVRIEETEEAPAQRPFRPTLARSSVLWAPREPIYPQALPSDLPPVVAFHSFKGGVGRTLHALALATTLARRNRELPVLLVDADLEAPGLTWLFQERFPQPAVSFVDLLALVHGDPSPESISSISLVADRVRESHLDGIYGLAAFRSPSQFNSLEIRPEHLIQGAEDPFILTSVLARLGKAVGAQAVIVDLRAGFSELSAGLLLDPRVYRVFVTTLSGQSLDGTCQLLGLLGSLAPSRTEEQPLPALVISQTPTNPLFADHVAESERRLLDAAKPFVQDLDEDAALAMVRITSPFSDGLLVLPTSWTEVVKSLEISGIPNRLSPLADWLPLAEAPAKAQLTKDDLPEKRRRLSGFASTLVYAETMQVLDFLPISPLKSLASDFASRAPIAVVVGSKGAGKTYTYLQAVYRGIWSRFVRDAGSSPVYEAFLCPVLKPLNLKGSAQAKADETLAVTAGALGFSEPANDTLVRDFLRDSQKARLHEGEWRERWLNLIAWRLGFAVNDRNAGAQLPEALRRSKKSAIAIIDGLEDIFQGLSNEAVQQTALRSLLQDVPDWLDQQPQRPVGLIVFVRRDMVLSAVRQNAAQLMARYEQYALKWGPEEALRLVAWTAAKADDLAVGDLEMIGKADQDELVTALAPLWGRKLGSVLSREARSADWVIAALSDLKAQIQARDLVRFLSVAAKLSLGDTYWKDRILAPAAIRSAVAKCSEDKIQEIGLENPELDRIFTKLRALPEPDRQIPFTRDQVELAIEDLKSLEDNGAIVRDGEDFYMPEIFRVGLGFGLKRGARPRVMTLARSTRR